MSGLFNSSNSTLSNLSSNGLEIFGDNSFIPKALSTDTIVVFMVLYILIIVLAVFSNLTVIVVIGKTRSVRSVTDVLILSLAVSDLMVACLNMPFQLYYIVSNEWDIGDGMCKFANYIQGVSVVSSIFTLTAIAFER